MTPSMTGRIKIGLNCISPLVPQSFLEKKPDDVDALDDVLSARRLSELIRTARRVSVVSTNIKEIVAIVAAKVHSDFGRNIFFSLPRADLVLCGTMGVKKKIPCPKEDIMSEKNFNELAQRACRDEEAFEELYEYFFPRVYNFIYARLKNTADADDITSITFMKMNENLELFNPSKAAFSTWLFKIASNAIVDHTRKVDRHQEAEWDECFDPAAPEYNEPEAQVIGAESNRELLKALGTLNARDRQIVELKFFADLDSKAIADIMSMSEGNVRVTIHRALAKLKNALST